MKKVQDPALSMRARARCHVSRVCRAVMAIPYRKYANLNLALLVAVAAFFIYLIYLMEYLLSHPNYISAPNFSLML